MIEKDLGRIATALESIAKSMAQDEQTPKPETVTPPAPKQKVPTAPPVKPVETAPAPTVQLSAEELNEGLVKEFNRLGGRELIDGVIKGFGADSVTTLSPDDYAEVLAKVQAL